MLGRLLAPGTCSPPLYLSDQIATLEADAQHFGTYVELRPPRFRFVARSVHERLEHLNNVAGLMRDSWTRSREIVAAIRAHPVDVIVGASGNPFDLPAAYLAARALRLPYVAYLFDDPVYQWEPGVYRSLSRFWERFWARDAAVIIAPNEILADDIRRRVPTAQIEIVRNPVGQQSLSERSVDDDRPPPTAERPWRILYTGSVYSAQASAFRNVVAALDRLDGLFKLDVYTSQGTTQVESCGLVGPHVTRHDHAAQDASLRLQRVADLLLLPLAFEAPIPEVIRSSAPAKLGEYLASGRPILVHAPKGSFVSTLFRRASAGAVVDEPNVEMLVDALRRLSTDSAAISRLVGNAMALSKEFELDRARNAFWSAIAMASL